MPDAAAFARAHRAENRCSPAARRGVGRCAVERHPLARNRQLPPAKLHAPPASAGAAGARRVRHPHPVPRGGPLRALRAHGVPAERVPRQLRGIFRPAATGRRVLQHRGKLRRHAAARLLRRSVASAAGRIPQEPAPAVGGGAQGGYPPIHAAAHRAGDRRTGDLDARHDDPVRRDRAAHRRAGRCLRPAMACEPLQVRRRDLAPALGKLVADRRGVELPPARSGLGRS